MKLQLYNFLPDPVVWSASLESEESLVRFPVDTYVFILNFLLASCSLEPDRAHANVLEGPLPVLYVVLDPRYDTSYKAYAYVSY